VLDDLKELYHEFDLHSLTHPASVEHFIMNLVIVGVLLLVAYVLFKLVSQLF
jgi:hypothetical protein